MLRILLRTTLSVLAVGAIASVVTASPSAAGCCGGCGGCYGGYTYGYGYVPMPVLPPAPIYLVDQGPVYGGPGVNTYPGYEVSTPPIGYPYVGGYYGGYGGYDGGPYADPYRHGVYHHYRGAFYPAHVHRPMIYGAHYRSHFVASYGWRRGAHRSYFVR